MSLSTRDRVAALAALAFVAAGAAFIAWELNAQAERNRLDALGAGQPANLAPAVATAAFQPQAPVVNYAPRPWSPPNPEAAAAAACMTEIEDPQQAACKGAYLGAHAAIQEQARRAAGD